MEMAKAFATNESIIGYANEILQLEFQSWEEEMVHDALTGRGSWDAALAAATVPCAAIFAVQWQGGRMVVLD